MKLKLVIAKPRVTQLAGRIVLTGWFILNVHHNSVLVERSVPIKKFNDTSGHLAFQNL
jgi:hypothetical protein